MFFANSVLREIITNIDYLNQIQPKTATEIGKRAEFREEKTKDIDKLLSEKNSLISVKDEQVQMIASSLSFLTMKKDEVTSVITNSTNSLISLMVQISPVSFSEAATNFMTSSLSNVLESTMDNITTTKNDEQSKKAAIEFSYKIIQNMRSISDKQLKEKIVGDQESVYESDNIGLLVAKAINSRLFESELSSKKVNATFPILTTNSGIAETISISMQYYKVTCFSFLFCRSSYLTP